MLGDKIIKGLVSFQKILILELRSAYINFSSKIKAYFYITYLCKKMVASFVGIRNSAGSASSNLSLLAFLRSASVLCPSFSLNWVRIFIFVFNLLTFITIVNYGFTG